MTDSPIQSVERSSKLAVAAIGRLAWAVMFVAHLPAVLAVLSGPGNDPARGALLLLSQTVFLLKVLDVAWLRLPASPRARFALFVIVLLLHGGVLIDLAAGDHDLLAAEDLGLLVEGLGAGGLMLTLTRRRRPVCDTRPARMHASFRAHRFDTAPPRFLTWLAGIRLQRPPPRALA